MTDPLVSVIVPTYNRERYLGEALESIARQDYRPIEVIVADDGSTDGTARVAESFPKVRVLRIEHAGVSAARNAAIAASTGPLLAFLDSDDLWAPGNLAKQVLCLRAHPEVECCFGRLRNFLEPGHTMPSWVMAGEFESNPISICAMLVRRGSFDRVGLFDTRLQFGEDVDWFFRARHAGLVFATVPDADLHRRIHGSNCSIDRGQQFDVLSMIAKSHMARARLMRSRVGARETSP